MRRISVAFVFLFVVASCSAQSAPCGCTFSTTYPSNPLNSCPLNFHTGMTCYQATVSCPNTDDMPMTFGYEEPQGPQNSGTIVLMSGGGGTQPSDTQGQEDQFAATYLTNHYEVVELKWMNAWEDTNFGINPPPSPWPYNIQTAACRPATFLWWAYNNLYVNNPNDTRGYCAQGISAGSAQIAYPMVLYGGAGSAFPLDKVELLSGPVLSDIAQGCELPQVGPVTVCPSGASYCNPDTPWQISPAYVYGPETSVATWSGEPYCAYSPQQFTSQQENQAWKAMSIVNGTSGTFNFPKTNISGWLCESVYQGNLCQNNGSTYCMNNSSPQGQLFYSQVAAAGTPFTLYPVTTCDTAEVVSGPDAKVPGLGNENGFTAISNDMSNSAGQCTKSPNR